MKRPSFQFYPGDWLRDTALRSVSVGARGAWIDMICLMHEGTPYGHLKVNQKVILPVNLARMIGLTSAEVEGYLEELKEAGVCDMVDGCISCRRMIRDEEIRHKRAEGGSKGGNPSLVHGKVNHEDNHKDNFQHESEVKQKPTPSSASSVASASALEIGREDAGAPNAPKPTPSEPRPKKPPFQVPTETEVSEYAVTLGLSPNEAAKFLSHYKSNGWMVGKNHMKDWKAAMSGWKMRDIKGHNGQGAKSASKSNEDWFKASADRKL